MNCEWQPGDGRLKPTGEKQTWQPTTPLKAGSEGSGQVGNGTVKPNTTRIRHEDTKGTHHTVYIPSVNALSMDDIN